MDYGNATEEYNRVFKAKISQLMIPTVADTLKMIVQREWESGSGFDSLWVACIAFSYGVMWGRRDERARRRGKPIFARY